MGLGDQALTFTKCVGIWSPNPLLTSVRVDFKLAPRNGSRRELFLGAKTVKASRSEAFTVLAFKIL
jgi:hypothetical protein